VTWQWCTGCRARLHRIGHPCGNGAEGWLRSTQDVIDGGEVALREACITRLDKQQTLAHRSVVEFCALRWWSGLPSKTFCCQLTHQHRSPEHHFRSRASASMSPLIYIQGLSSSCRDWNSELVLECARVLMSSMSPNLPRHNRTNER
jgi:hypothetical protein